MKTLAQEYQDYTRNGQTLQPESAFYMGALSALNAIREAAPNHEPAKIHFAMVKLHAEIGQRCGFARPGEAPSRS